MEIYLTDMYDLSKATISFNVLFEKLSRFNLNIQNMNLIKAYLSNRKEFSVVNNILSALVPI